jgi:hypothetical protein
MACRRHTTAGAAMGRHQREDRHSVATKNAESAGDFGVAVGESGHDVVAIFQILAGEVGELGLERSEGVPFVQQGTQSDAKRHPSPLPMRPMTQNGRFAAVLSKPECSGLVRSEDRPAG